MIKEPRDTQLFLPPSKERDEKAPAQQRQKMRLANFKITHQLFEVTYIQA